MFRTSFLPSVFAIALGVFGAGCSNPSSTVASSGKVSTKLTLLEGRELNEKERELLKDPRVAKSILADAAREDDDKTLSALARYGIDVDQPLGEGRTALAIAAYRRAPRAVAALLGLHADPNGHTDLTPLMHAAFVGDDAIVKLLVDAGAVVDRPTGYGQTPLMFAALFGRRETYDTLIRLGADENAADRIGNTPKNLRAYANNADAAETFLRHASSSLVGFAKRHVP